MKDHVHSTDRWKVRLGEGGRVMTQEELDAAFARNWIDERTPVLGPEAPAWTLLADARERVEIEDAPPSPSKKDLETSAMIVLSGEIEIVSDESPLDQQELSVTRPPRLAPKLLAAALVALAAASVYAHYRIPALAHPVASMKAAFSDLRADMAPAATPPPALTTPRVQTIAPPPPPSPSPSPVTVTASATLAHVPKMRAPTPPPPMKTTTASTAKRTEPRAKKKTAPTTPRH